MRLLPIAILSLLAFLSAPAPARADGDPAPFLREAIERTGRRDYAAADSLAALALEQAAIPPRDSAALALAHQLRGNARIGMARYRDSLLVQSFEEALRLYARMSRPDTLAWIQAHVFYSRGLVELERVPDALGHLEASRRLGSPALAGRDSAIAESWFATGRTLRRSRDLPGAAAALRRSLEIQERLRGVDDVRLAPALAELGGAQMLALEFDEAGAAFERAVTLIERAHGPLSPQLGQPLAFLANQRHLLGDVAGSIEILDRVIALTEATYGADSPRLVPPRFNRANRLADLGDYPAVIAEFRALLPICERAFGPEHGRTRLVLQSLGAVEAMAGDPAAAGHLARARALHGAGANDPDRGADLVARHQSLLRLRAGDARGALAVADSALGRTGAPPLSVWLGSQLLEARLDAALAFGDPAVIRATAGMLDSLARRSDARDPVFVAGALRDAARGLERLGDRDAAWARAAEAEDIERLRLRRNLRTLPDRHGLQLADRLAEPLDLMLRLAADTGGERIETAWDRLVRWRGMVRAELAERRIGRDAGPEVVAAHAEWLELRRRLAQREVHATADGDSAAAARLAAARAAAEQAELRLAQRMGGVRRDSAEVTLAGVRGALGARALVSITELAPRTDTARVVALVAADGAAKARFVDLGPRAALRPLVGAWRDALSAPPGAGRERDGEREARRLGERVHAATWARLEPHLAGAREIVLVADGDLAGLPWGALPVARGRYLVEENTTIVTLASERDLLAAALATEGPLLAVGAPDFGSGLSPSADAPLALRGPLGSCASRGDLALTPLPGALAEIEDVTRIHAAGGAHVAAHFGAGATERLFKTKAPGSRVLHLATHGIVWGDSCAQAGAGTRGIGGVAALDAPAPKRRPAAAAAAPARADAVREWNRGRRVWLALAGANRARYATDSDDGLLTADEVAALDLAGVDWVVLSACQSAAGEGWPREGPLGMQRAFWVAGARSVIASQWPIGDDSTREWMVALYTARAAGARGAARAMDAASRAVLESRRASGRSTHPFYWAAFTAQGE